MYIYIVNILTRIFKEPSIRKSRAYTLFIWNENSKILKQNTAQHKIFEFLIQINKYAEEATEMPQKKCHRRSYRNGCEIFA